MTKLILFIALTFVSSNTFGQFAPVLPNNEGLFICESRDEFEPAYYARSTFDTIYMDSEGLVFVPYKTLSGYTGNSLCGFYPAGNWLGDTIYHNAVQDEFTFEFSPVKFNNGTGNFELTPKTTFSIPFSTTVGHQFAIDTSIDAEIISKSSLDLLGLTMIVITIRLTNNGSNPDYQWNSGEIIISDLLGLIQFPNLQYFPFEWLSCKLAGLENPSVGVQNLSIKDIYRMEAGDEYTAEGRYTWASSDFYAHFQRIVCLEVLDEDDTYQNRNIQKEIVRWSNEFKKWIYQIDTLEETIVYEMLPLAGKANETRPFFDSLEISYVVLSEEGKKFAHQLIYDEYHDCYGRYIDGCYYHFSFEGGFDYYYDCSGIFSFENYYLPRHRIKGGVVTGTPVDFDSLLLSKKSIQLVEISIFPNPNRGIFQVKLPETMNISTFCLMNAQGDKIKLQPKLSGDNVIQFEVDIPTGLYMLQGIDRSGNYLGLGKLMLMK